MNIEQKIGRMMVGIADAALIALASLTAVCVLALVVANVLR